MKKNQIKDSINGIEFTEKTKRRILKGVCEKNNRKVTIRRIRTGVAVACMIAIFAIMNTMIGKPYNTEITVYAMNKEGKEQNIILPIGKEIVLKPLQTPVGYGYIFELDIPDNYRYESVPTDNAKNIFTVYQNGKYIYWIPNKQISGKIYSSANQELDTDEIPNIDECRFEIIIYNDRKIVLENKIVEFKLAENNCVAILKE